jgi:hypothetical protein
MNNSDYVYLDLDYTNNNTTDNKTAILSVNRYNPILTNIEQYKMTITRFYTQTTAIPYISQDETPIKLKIDR